MPGTGDGATITGIRMRKGVLPALILLAFLLGAGLRLHGIRGQVLLDDEWHGVSFVIGKTCGQILSGFNPTDNSSPPLNLYRLWLRDTVGWSETGLRLPALLAGLAGVCLMPWCLRREVGARAAVLFAFLLAIAPLLVFYSRFSRAYSIVALLGFLTIFACFRWADGGRWRVATCFVLSAGLVVFFHLSALIVAAAPLGVVLAAKGVDRAFASTGRRRLVTPGLPACLLTAGVLLLLLLMVLIPPLRHSASLPWGRGDLAALSAARTAAMLSGTANPFAATAFMLAMVGGAVCLWRSKPLLVWMVLGTAVACAAALAISRPAGADHPIVVLRYAMALVPWALLFAAVGLDRALQGAAAVAGPRYGRPVAATAAVACVVLLLLLGPLTDTYRSTNSFTNHSAFQGAYGRRTWARSDARHILPAAEIAAADVPLFYKVLGEADAVKAIVEYPLDICNYNNRFYYYQHFHGKAVIAGYTTDRQSWGIELAEDPAAVGGFTLGMLAADQILCRVSDPSRLAFRNMVDVANAAQLKRSGAAYLVLHKDLRALKVLPDGFGTVTVRYRSTALLAERYRSRWGEPVFEDDRIVVFQIPTQ